MLPFLIWLKLPIVCAVLNPDWMSVVAQPGVPAIQAAAASAPSF